MQKYKQARTDGKAIMIICWRCKKEFNPEKSFFYPNMRETCQPCVMAILPGSWPYALRANLPDKLIQDVLGIKLKKAEGYNNSADFAPEVKQAEAIIAGKGETK